MVRTRLPGPRRATGGTDPGSCRGGCEWATMTRQADQRSHLRPAPTDYRRPSLPTRLHWRRCLLVPPYLKASVGPPRAFTLQEAADLLTPLVIVPLAWIVFDLAGGLGRRGMVAFLAVAALWVEGQGIHLAANAIGDAFPHAATEAFYQTVPGELDLWLDETLSHWMWHVAWVGLAILMLAAAARDTARRTDRTSCWPSWPASSTG